MEHCYAGQYEQVVVDVLTLSLEKYRPTESGLSSCALKVSPSDKPPDNPLQVHLWSYAEKVQVPVRFPPESSESSPAMTKRKKRALT